MDGECSQIGKIFEELGSEAMAFLGVKLYAEDLAFLNGRVEINAVARLEDASLGVIGKDCIRMNEVESSLFLEPKR